MSGQRLLQLINDILDAAKMKQGSLVIKHQDVRSSKPMSFAGSPFGSWMITQFHGPIQVDVQALMKDVMDITKSLVSRKVELISKVGNVPHIIGDGDRLVQIMYNLIGNAGDCRVFNRVSS